MQSMVTLAEPEARKVVLVQALEDDAEGGALASEAEVSAAEREVLARHHVPPGEPPQPQWYLPARAKEILQYVGKRRPALVRLADEDALWKRLGIGLSLVALALGFGSDQIGDPHNLDLLALPLLGFVAWNLAIYVLLLASLLTRGKFGFADWLLRWIADLPEGVKGVVGGRLRRSVATRFRLHWWRTAGALEGLRVQRSLHMAAAAWALGVILSIGAHGLSKEYRVGWESTWLNAGQVHWLANVISAPGRALVGAKGYSREEIEALHGVAKGGQDVARKWALLYVTFLLASVVLPRLALAFSAAVRLRRGARRVRIDISQPYYVELMERVSPARLRVRIASEDKALRDAIDCVLRQAANEGRALPRTAENDELVLVGDDAEADQVWLLASTAEGLRASLAGLPASAATIVLAGDGVDFNALEQPLRGAAAETLPLRTIACWPLEATLRDAMQRHAPARKRAGVVRLARAWAAQHEARWGQSVRALAHALAQSAADSEPVERKWLGFGGKAREAAMEKLLARLEERLASLHGELLRINAADGLLPRSSVGEGRDALGGLLSEGNAGVAGALAGLGAGALAGAHIDLMTGGLTMGAGAALGALIGGAGAFGAARFWDLGGRVRLGDEQLQSLAESLVLQYLAVVHAGRPLPQAAQDFEARWRSEAIAAVARGADELRDALKAVRDASGETAAQQEVATALRRACSAAFRALYPAVDLYCMREQ